MRKSIKIIDLFAGPGGLGEGFSSFTTNLGAQPFKIALSIEKEKSAHSTLTLRAFYRQFRTGEAPNEYYSFLRGELGKTPEEVLYKIPAFRREVEAAIKEARCLTLGEDNSKIDKALDAVLKDGEDCILIGGPPCQAYSLVGRARRNGMAGYLAEEDGRNFLYKEYLRILKRCQPLVFVMENVKGMLSAEVGGERVFGKIISDLTDPWGSSRDDKKHYRIFSLVVRSDDNDDAHSYAPDDFVIRMERFGIPQARHRVILLGLREDIADRWSPGFVLSPEASIPLEKIIGSLPPLRSGLSKETDSFGNWLGALKDLGGARLKEIRSYAGNHVLEEIRIAIEMAAKTPDSRGANFAEACREDPLAGAPKRLREWYQDPRHKKLVCNHETRGHMRTDLHRYLYCSAWAKAAGLHESISAPFPRPENYPPSLAPAHDSFHSGAFADRFRVQQPNQCATTVTSHISKDGHYFIHYDPAQCRSLTVREAARIQTFPDNYFFLGNRTQQYVQVGNAVPPLLARKIAGAVHDIIHGRCF